MKENQIIDEVPSEVPVTGKNSNDRAVFRCLLIAGATVLVPIFLGRFWRNEPLARACIESAENIGFLLFLLVGAAVLGKGNAYPGLAVIGGTEIILFIIA